MKDAKNNDLKRGAEVILRGRVTSMNDSGDPNTETITFVANIPVTEGKPLTFYLRPGQVEMVEETPGVKETPPTDPNGRMGIVDPPQTETPSGDESGS